MVGILAFGSLIEDPGVELAPLIRRRIEGVQTPFAVEFARSSGTRDGAPTLIPVKNGGSPVKGTILVLDDTLDLHKAADLLWRRETRNEGSNRHYQRPPNPGPNAVTIEQLPNFQGLPAVLYTSIGANIPNPNPETLADLAVKSARAASGARGTDGISYLLSVKRQGIATPLMTAYEQAILRQTNTTKLEDARSAARSAKPQARSQTP